jgi:hypothetical protein
VINPTQGLLPENTRYSKETNLNATAVGYGPTIQTSEQLQTHSLECAAADFINIYVDYENNNNNNNNNNNIFH